jgi:hypothetical protein
MGQHCNYQLDMMKIREKRGKKYPTHTQKKSNLKAEMF